jgi:hypothetical protein
MLAAAKIRSKHGIAVSPVIGFNVSKLADTQVSSRIAIMNVDMSLEKADSWGGREEDLARGPITGKH